MHQSSSSCLKKNQNHTQTQNISSHNRPQTNKTCFNNTKYLCCYLLPHTTLQSSSSRRKLVQRAVNLTTLHHPLLLSLSHFSLLCFCIYFLSFFLFSSIPAGMFCSIALPPPFNCPYYLDVWFPYTDLLSVCVCCVFPCFPFNLFPFKSVGV